MAISLCIQDLGLIDYQVAWEKQRKIQAELIAGSQSEALIFCEHCPVLTYGGSADLSKVLLADSEDLMAEGIQLIKTDRGGNITYHGPGQLTCYLILDLKKRRQDVSWYLRTLEQGIIDLLLCCQVQAITIPSQTGVWTSQHDKICSIGVRMSRWCSMHGLALNLSRQVELGFKQIIPCGIAGARATSIETISGQIPDRAELIKRASDIFIKCFYSNFNLAHVIQ